MFLIRIVFILTMSTIGITFLFKIIENRETKKLWKLENEYESMNVELTKLKNRLTNIDEQFKKSTSRKNISKTADEFEIRAYEINAPGGLREKDSESKPDSTLDFTSNIKSKSKENKEHKQHWSDSWILRNHPLNRVHEVLKKECEDLEQKIDEKKEQIIEEKNNLYNNSLKNKKPNESNISNEIKRIDEISKGENIIDIDDIDIETDKHTIQKLLFHINEKLQKKEDSDDLKVGFLKSGPEPDIHITLFISKIDEIIKEEFKKLKTSLENYNFIDKGNDKVVKEIENIKKQLEDPKFDDIALKFKSDILKLISKWIKPTNQDDITNLIKSINLNMYLKKLNEKIIEVQKNIADEFNIGEESKDKKRSDQLLIFSALFAIIGGLAITSALETFADPTQNTYIQYAHNIYGFTDLITSKPAFVIASFFPIAILFIHCGVIFLSTNAVNAISQGKRAGYFFSALLIFLSGVILYYASSQINDILNFSFWIFLLMLFDIVWVVYNWKSKIDYQPQWLHFDLSMLFFTLSILLLFHSLTQIETEVYLYMLIVFVGRTFADYIAGWRNVWSKFDVSNSGF